MFSVCYIPNGAGWQAAPFLPIFAFPSSFPSFPSWFSAPVLSQNVGSDSIRWSISSNRSLVLAASCWL